MSILKVRNLSFAYDKNAVFSGIDLDVNEGEIFCLAGPNGCGKTTLMHCIMTHLKAKDGEITLGEKQVQAYKAEELAKWIAYVPQNHVRSFPYLAIDVVAMGATRMGNAFGSMKASRENALRYMKMLGIEDLAEVEYNKLSGGELQMVLIARALTQESEILILDEPVAHLDIKRAQNILKLLAKLSKEQGKTIIMSTHDYNHPLMLEDEGANVKVALMEKGSLFEAGVPSVCLAGGCLEKTYGIKSKLLEIDTGIKRHYLASWSEE